jgi:hypothetical protein
MAEEPIPTSDYLRTPEVLVPQELVYGYVREAAAPTAAHQRTVGALFIRLPAESIRSSVLPDLRLTPLDVIGR